MACYIKKSSTQKLDHSYGKKEAFTFLMNTDGISLAEKSNLSIWPIFFAINELPVEERFWIDNIIIADTKFYYIVRLNIKNK
jgi:hypothetical protein